MSLAGRVIAHLRLHGVPCAIIGGVAMAIHGIARATVDVDVLVAGPEVLVASFWQALAPDVAAQVRRGDVDDPLAGVVRCVSGVEVVDVVVGVSRWMSDTVARAVPREFAGETLPVVEAADLVVLKLYAGGPQDLLDVRLLLGADPVLHGSVAARAGSSPPLVLARLREIAEAT